MSREYWTQRVKDAERRKTVRTTPRFESSWVSKEENASEQALCAGHFPVIPLIVLLCRFLPAIFSRPVECPLYLVSHKTAQLKYSHHQV